LTFYFPKKTKKKKNVPSLLSPFNIKIAESAELPLELRYLHVAWCFGDRFRVDGLSLGVLSIELQWAFFCVDDMRLPSLIVEKWMGGRIMIAISVALIEVLFL